MIDIGGISKFERNSIFDPGMDIHFASLGSFKDIAGIHSHDFFEIFMVSQGEVIHYVNGTRQVLSEGALVFIRPDDVHYYEQKDMADCKLINVAFTQELAMSIISSIGGGIGMEFFTKPEVAPDVYIPGSDRSIITYRVGRLNSMMYPDMIKVRFELRILVYELLLYFLQYYHSNVHSYLPEWIQDLCVDMENRENLVAGCKRLFQLSGKSQEHVCRMFKQHLHMTPTEYVNQLRLNYAKNLLVNSNEEILEICLQSGFENLSYFYHCFKKQYGSTPRQFRNDSRKVQLF